MNLTHIHLMINHVPILGSYLLFFVFGYAVILKKEQIFRQLLWSYVLIAIATVLVYLTGDPAADVIKKLPGMNTALIQNHEDIAFIALLIIIALGVASLIGLKYFKKEAPLPAWFKYGFLVIAFASIVTITWAAQIGGMIHHPEILSSFNSSMYK
jgi:magnesium-transporting ATPase (P-type)